MMYVQKIVLTLIVCLAFAAASCDKSTPPAPEQATPHRDQGGGRDQRASSGDSGNGIIQTRARSG